MNTSGSGQISMKVKVLALILCAALAIFTLAGCNMKLKNPEAEPSGGENSAAVIDLSTYIGIVSKIEQNTVTLEFVEPYAAPASAVNDGGGSAPSGGADAGTDVVVNPAAANLVVSGSSLFSKTGETGDVTVTNNSAVILQNEGYGAGTFRDIKVGDFLAVAMNGGAVIAAVDNGPANDLTAYTGKSGAGEESESSGSSPEGSAETESPEGGTGASPDSGTSSSGGPAYVVTEDGLKARSGPSTAYEILGELKAGTKLTGTITDGWLEFTYSGKTAYCNADYLQLESGVAIPDDSTPRTYEVTENDLKIRSGPSTIYEILGKFALGDKVTGIVTEGWLQFSYNGKTAYCKAQYLKVSA
jgi:uncharacterized protein YraI